MRIALVLLPALLLGCAQAARVDVGAACLAQGHQPGGEAYRACVDAGGAALATGPGSPYANVDEEEGA